MSSRKNAVNQLPAESSTARQLSLPAGYEEMEFRLSVELHVLDAAEGIETPLGRYVDGRWQPLPKLESVFELSPENLADDLSSGLLGDFLAAQGELAADLIRDTRRRCETLAAASAAQRAEGEDSSEGQA